MLSMQRYFVALTKLKISQQKIAQITGSSVSSVNAWTKGAQPRLSAKNIFDYTELCRIALGVYERELDFVQAFLLQLELTDVENKYISSIHEDYALSCTSDKQLYERFMITLIQMCLDKKECGSVPLKYDRTGLQRPLIGIGIGHIIGAMEDGRAIASGADDYQQCHVHAWRDVVAVSAGWRCSAALKKDGTCVAIGKNIIDDGTIFKWENITSISCGTFHTIGLKSDGTVIAIGRDGFGQCDLDSWNHITAVAAGYNHSVGLTKEKRVVCKGSNEYGQCNTQEWRNVIAIAAAGDHTIGLTENGTVLATGDIQSFRFDKWSDVMSIATGTYHVVGLKKDGTVIATGHNANGQCDVYRWYDIAQVYAGFFKTVAIRSDGHVLSTTSEHELDRTHPDTSTWRLFESKGNLERKSKFESVKSQFREMLLNIKQKAVECMPLINNRGVPGGEFVLEHTREFDKSIEYLWKESKRSWELYQEVDPLPPISDLMLQYNASFSDFFNSLKIEKTSEDTEAIPRFFPTENTYSTFVDYYTQIGQIERQLNLME